MWCSCSKAHSGSAHFLLIFFLFILSLSFCQFINGDTEQIEIRDTLNWYKKNGYNVANLNEGYIQMAHCQPLLNPPRWAIPNMWTLVFVGQ